MADAEPDAVEARTDMRLDRAQAIVPGVPAAGLGAELAQREIELVGAYAYGTEELPDGREARTFDLAFELAAAAELGRLVSARYPLERYREAIEHAATAGPRGAVKIVFEPQMQKLQAAKEKRT